MTSTERDDVAEESTLTLDSWLEAGQPRNSTVLLNGDDELEQHYAALAEQPRLIISFPTFMDGRGFSHGRKLRQHGFAGQLLADGDVLRDQEEFLRRCGFDGLLGEAPGGIPDFNGFSVRYQAG